MPRFAYVNGRFVQHAQAMVHIEDRGFQFADGVYEVVTVHNGHFVDEAGHIDRLARSLRELSMAWPTSRPVLGLLMRELVRRNRVRNGLLYIQVTRGAAPRDFRFPANAKPTLVMTLRRANLSLHHLVAAGVPVITVPDIRWKRRDIKSVSLLAQVLGKQKAAEAGAFEAWMVEEDGLVTEGTSSNAWIVTADGILVTRHPTTSILRGVTRQAVIRIAGEEGIAFEERPFHIDEALQAREAFLTAATSYVMPITRIDGQAVADGAPGPLTRRLREVYTAFAVAEPPAA